MNTNYKRLDSINDIPDVTYDGYIWMSDSKNPKRVSSKSDLLTHSSNPFIVEGELISSDGELSLSIRHYGTGVTIWQYDMKEIAAMPDSQKSESNLLVHRLDGVEKIKFITFWIPQADEQCAGMQVLKPAMRVFNGFILKK